MTRNAHDLTDREVARALRKSLRTVQRYCAKGALPGAYKAGRSWRIPRAALDAPHRGAVDRLAAGPMAETLKELRGTSTWLRRAHDQIGEADLQTVKRLVELLQTLGAELTEAGKRAHDRRRALERDQQLAGHIKARHMTPAK